MNQRERVLSVLNGRVPDCVPWFGDLDYWVGSMVKKGTLPDKYKGDGYFKLHSDLGVGFYLQGCFPFDIEYEGVEIEEKRTGDFLQKTIRTPAGCLISEKRYLPNTFSWAIVRHMLNNIDDLPAFLYLTEHTTYKSNSTVVLRKKELAGDNGLSLCYLPRSPFMDLATEISGIENLVFLLADWPEEMALLLEAMELLSDKAANIALNSPAECLMIPENLSSEVVGDEYYIKYLRPYEKKWTDRIRQAGKFSFIHMDGTLKGLVRLVAETGFDVLEALTPFPTGDMSLKQIATVVPARSVIWGGLPGILFTPHVTDDEFDRHVIETLELMRTTPRFVLGVADQVPPDGIWERVAKVRIMVEKYGCTDK